jgi:hypothetical protein
MILNSKDGLNAEPPSGVAGYTSNSSLQSKVAVELVNQSANKVK